MDSFNSHSDSLLGRKGSPHSSLRTYLRDFHVTAVFLVNSIIGLY